MNVDLSLSFENKLKNFPKSDRDKIFNFISHVRKYGLTELAGRNKSSDNVPKNDPNWRYKVAYTQRHHLWHYHIGIICYKGVFGDQTSEYVLHYIRLDDTIKLVAMSSHPPFELPNEIELI